MAKTDTRKTSSPLTLGVIGAGGFASQTLAAIADFPDAQVIAVSDVKRDVAENAAQKFAARVYVDVRSMMVETGVEAILMSLPHDEYPEAVRLAAQRGLHLLKETPLARSIDEALSLTKLYDQADRVFMIATHHRFAPGFVALKAKLASFPKPFLVRTHALFNWAGDFGWRGQRGRAGFGTLGDAGYQNIDLLNWLLGPPAAVFAMTSGGSRAKPLHPYDTDDTGLCVLHWDTGLMGNVTCSRVTAPAAMDIVLHTPAGTLIASPESFRVIDLDGQVVEEQSVSPQQAAREAMLGKLAAFIAAVRSGKRPYPCSAHENLVNQAVVEAAYLSSRTGQPQVPAQIFELHGRSMHDFVVHDPSAAAAAEKPSRSRRPIIRR